MYNLVERRPLWFIISLLFIVPGILFCIWFSATQGTILPLSIDYTGGTLWEMRFENPVTPGEMRQAFEEAGYSGAVAFPVEDDRTIQVKSKEIDIDAKEVVKAAIEERFGAFEERSYRSIGPTIGAEVSRAALIAVIVSSLLIMVYIAFAFRAVENPFRYGVCAVAALVHDVLVMVGFIALMYFVAGWEVDALFLTAALTVIGFSVNDTIVVFDRIRENVKRYRAESFATVANRSLIETAQRSLGTVVTVLFVMVSILVLGGASIQRFMAVLVIGVISGTYSSLFNATPLLVAWEERSLLPRKKRASALREQTASA
ncbi:MAG: protein translocase subunit SecF [Chloroflexota bacterium]